MGKLVECKTCKHQVDQFAKMCPNCGAKNPGTKAYQGCLLLILTVASIFTWLSLKDKAPDAEDQVFTQANLIEQIKISEPISNQAQLPVQSGKPIAAPQVPILNDANINDFLQSYANDYATYAMKLAKGFNKFKVENDYHGYVLFKNKQWYPGFDERRKYYDTVLDANRKYLFDNGMIVLISQFTDLSLRAEDFFADLRNKDKSKRKLATELLARDISYLEDAFKKRGMKFEVYLQD